MGKKAPVLGDDLNWTPSNFERDALCRRVSLRAVQEQASSEFHRAVQVIEAHSLVNVSIRGGSSGPSSDDSSDASSGATESLEAISSLSGDQENFFEGSSTGSSGEQGYFVLVRVTRSYEVAYVVRSKITSRSSCEVFSISREQ